MSFYHGTIRADSLSMYTHVNVLLPDHAAPERTLLLLHGLSDNCDAWVRRTAIGRLTDKYRLAVVMPQVQRSWYIDMAYGLKYFTYVFEELPVKMAAEFRIPTDPDHLFIGGLSMGGYGAMKCVATAPEKYAGCIALSSCFYPMDRSLWRNDVAGSEQDEWKAILGPELPFGDENDIEKLTEKALAAGKKLPKLYMACGTEDGLLRMSRKLHDFFLTNDIPCSYEEWSGIHDWWFWDTGIQKGLAQMFPGE